MSFNGSTSQTKFLLGCAQSEVSAEIATDKVFVQGADRQGRPCMYILAAKHVVAERDVEECKRFVCYALDRCIEQIDPSKNPSGTISIVFDLRGEPPTPPAVRARLGPGRNRNQGPPWIYTEEDKVLRV